jgi:hypothetical protein
MFKIVVILILFTIPLRAQISPKEDCKLNYRIIGFSFPAEPRAGKYTIEIAAGSYHTEDSFVKNRLPSITGTTNKIIAEVPSFGAGYTWRIVYTGKKKVIKKSGWHHFSTEMNPHADTSKLHLKILQPAEQYKDAYVAVDAGGVIYDMNGNPVWYIPDDKGTNGNVIDLKFTPEGTITFINKNAYEINYNGDILWKTPNESIINKDTIAGDMFHHEFRKLSNGHYMALAMQLKWCKTISSKDSNYVKISDVRIDGNGYKRGKFTTIIEYDGNGNIVWSWQFVKHLANTDFDYFKPVDSNLKFDIHENAFFFDEKNNFIYLGSRNMNRIIKIEYPSGNIACTYGENYKPGGHSTGAGLFCNQHSINLSRDGYLYYFNNNSCRLTDSLPSVIMLQEPVSCTDTFKKIWEYICPAEKGGAKKYESGGNAIELPDRSLFINMGSDYSKLSIVTRDKKVLWSALPERMMEPDHIWTPIKEYRANIISRKDLEYMIWAAETQKKRNPR